MLTSDLDRADRGFLIGSTLPIRSWQGEDVQEALREVQSLLRGFEDPENASHVLGVQCHAALAAGQLDDAKARALERGGLSVYNRPTAYWLAARIALWMRDSTSALTDLALLDSAHAHGPAITLQKATIRAGLAALDGRPSDALSSYREVIRGWREAGLPVLEALTAIDMATLLDPTTLEVQAAATSAREIFGGLGASPFLERLDAALKRSSSPSTKARAVMASQTSDART